SGREQAGDAGELQHGEDGFGRAHHAERALRGLELLEVFYQHADAGGAEVIHLREVEVNVMLPRADGRLDGAAHPVGPVGVEPALELQFEASVAGLLGDFHEALQFTASPRRSSSGGMTTPAFAAAAGLNVYFNPSKSWNGMRAGDSPRRTRAAISADATPPSKK